MSVQRAGSSALESRPEPQSRAISPRPRSILSDITIEHGPVDLFGRFFLKADTAARERGVFLSFAPLQELVEANRRNRDTWRPLLPLFDPVVSGATTEDSFCIVGRNSSGEIVATQAARLYRWGDTTFHEEAESLRLLYADPERSKQPNETVEVTAKDAKKITGLVIFGGGAWYRPDYRGRQLAQILTRISRACAYTRW